MLGVKLVYANAVVDSPFTFQEDFRKAALSKRVQQWQRWIAGEVLSSRVPGLEFDSPVLVNA